MKRVFLALSVLMMAMLACNFPRFHPAEPPQFVLKIDTPRPAPTMSPHAVRIQYDYRNVIDPVKQPGIPGYNLSVFDNRVGPTQLSYELRWDNGTPDTSDDTVLTIFPSPVQTPFFGTLERLKEAQILLDSGNWKSPFEDTGLNAGTNGGFILYGPAE